MLCLHFCFYLWATSLFLEAVSFHTIEQKQTEQMYISKYKYIIFSFGLSFLKDISDAFILCFELPQLYVAPQYHCALH